LPLLLWDISHLEFTITDEYYFKDLMSLLEKKYKVQVVESLSDEVLKEADWLVLNYPELPFKEEEKQRIFDFVERGGNLISTAYYRNEDGVAGILNELFQELGICFRYDEVREENGSPFITTSKIVKPLPRVERVYLPCTCSLHLSGKWKPLVCSEKGQKSNLASPPLVYAAFLDFGRGKIFNLGTSVFWDNFSLRREDNLNLVKGILEIE
jgi:hypothetical protein